MRDAIRMLETWTAERDKMVRVGDLCPRVWAASSTVRKGSDIAFRIHLNRKANFPAS